MLYRSPANASVSRGACVALLLLVLKSTPLAAAPAINPVGTVQVPAGKTLIVPLSAQSPQNLPLTYTVTSSSPEKIGVTLHTNNPWLKLGVADFGEMALQLLRDHAPNTVDTIQALVQSGFYNGLTFHRVASGFMIQGGDPKGDGSGGPDFRFDDEFDPQAIFSGAGQLAMANSGKDSNGSQFFITVAPWRVLDFNHTIFGQLVRGFDVLTNISLVPTNNSNNRPKTPVVITNAMMFTNTTDAVITLAAANGGSASATITVRVTDSAGGTATSTFTAQRVADSVDDPPILGPLTNQISPENATVQVTLSATDLENNPVEYGYINYNVPVGTGFGRVSNDVTITPPAGYTGPITVIFAMRQQGALARGSTADPYDYQPLTVAVGDTASTVFNANFLATNGVTFSNRIIATFTNVNASRPVDKYTARINWGDGTVTNKALIQARTNGPGFEVLGTHTYTNAGDQRVVVDVTTVRGSVASSTGQVIVPPALRMIREAGEQSLRWPAWAFDYQLLSTTNVGSTNWVTVTNPPVVVGFENVASNAATAPGSFFRLRR